MTRARPANRGGMAFGRNLMVLALAPLAFGTYTTVMGALTLTWPRVNAAIISCERIFPESDRRNVGTADNSKGWAVTRLTYSYSVGGAEHIGTRVEAYDFGLANAAHEEALCLTYQPRQQVAVVYDPGKPDIAYLEPGPSRSALMLLGAGALMLLFGWRVRVLASRGLGTMNEEGATERIKQHRDGPGERW